jgi:pre-mRNA-processing factor 19
MADLKLDFVTLDVFTDTRYLGNPLAVVFVPAAIRDRLTQETKQRIAREFNLSETVFLHTLPNEPNTASHTREIDIFTPRGELPFAGHPTVGSSYLILHHLGWGHVDTLQTKAGPIRVEALAGEAGRIRAAIPHAVRIHQNSLGSLLNAPSTTSATVKEIERGLSPHEDIRAAELAAPVVSIVRGMTFVLVRLDSLEQLGRAPPVADIDFGGIDLLDEGEWKESFVSRYYYVLGENEGTAGGDERVKVRTRLLRLGFEDPATGSAACTLSSYLASTSGAVDKEVSFVITQGVEMGRKSDIAVDVAVQKPGSAGEGGVREVHLGGTAVVVMNGTLTV